MAHAAKCKYELVNFNSIRDSCTSRTDKPAMNIFSKTVFAERCMRSFFFTCLQFKKKKTNCKHTFYKFQEHSISATENQQRATIL